MNNGESEQNGLVGKGTCHQTVSETYLVKR